MVLTAATATPVWAQTESDPAALAVYADAANFQTNGATALAIDAWNRFLNDHADSPLASKAAHYLGVCHMQVQPPDLAAAATAFEQAIADRKSDLRQESLSNLGWCLYQTGAAGGEPDKNLLQKSRDTYATLLTENPDTRYRDRALFYSGEAEYLLGRTEAAVGFYDSMLRSETAADSDLRCDALYARGVALEELQKAEPAIASYGQFLDACGDAELAIDVRLRLGDLHIAQKNFDTAVTVLKTAASAANVAPADQAYALFRQGFALARAAKPGDAAAAYEQVIRRFPDSAYTAAATMAAAQTAYQASDWATAATRFGQIVDGQNAAAATEAAHWLTRMELATAAKQDDPVPAARRALAIAEKQLAAGPEGSFVNALRVDAAEAMAMIPEKLADSLAAFQAVADENRDDPLAPRALYNAAFTAMQLKKFRQAIELSSRFQSRYAGDALSPDVQFVDAESKRLDGQAGAAASSYQALLERVDGQDNDQRPLWVLRLASSLLSADQPRQAIDALDRESKTWTQPRLRAEAALTAGQAWMALNDPVRAAAKFADSRAADPTWARSDEAFLLAGVAQLAAGNADAAKGIWTQLVTDNPNASVADQARYKLGQLATQAGDYAAAIAAYTPIVNSDRPSSLMPFARYAKGWAEMESGQSRAAIDTLTQLISRHPDHALAGDALLSRGMAHRTENQTDAAIRDLDAFLESQPVGIKLGHALYELALIDQSRGQPADAATRLTRLVTEVADYPAMDKVVYELAWSFQQAGSDAKAVEQFERLIREFPDNELVAEAAYFVGQTRYAADEFAAAATSYQIAADKAADASLKEKSLFKLGWSQFNLGQWDAAETAFKRQYADFQDGPLVIDAMMMIGETRFKRGQYETALRAYSMTRDKIRDAGDSAKTVRDPSQRRVRELVLLHGGQAAAQLGRFDDAIEWYDELRERFPATAYLPQVFYETGFAQQQSGNADEALRYYSQVADNYRTEIAARARFMMGEIHFAAKTFDKALPEFQRVMYGFGAEQAPAEIKNWQAKSGFEAGRCAELLATTATTDAGRNKALGFARQFYQYVVQKHADHELAAKAQRQLQSVPAS